MAVKIGKFGETDADLKFHEVIEGNLLQIKDGIGEMLNAKFFIHPIDFMGMQRVERDEYPVDAVREMILNALVHRTYMGAPTQIRLYDDNFSVWNDGGLPEGISEEDLKKTGLNERQVKAVEYVKKHGRITNKVYQELNNVSKKTASHDLSELVNQNILKSSGVPGAGAFYEMQ